MSSFINWKGSDTPHTDKHVYKASARDIGFEVVAPTIARGLERRLATLRKLQRYRRGANYPVKDDAGEWVKYEDLITMLEATP